MTRPRPGRRQCEDTTREGLPCPANAMKRPDPDGRHRCPQHSITPTIAEAIRLSRHRGGFKTVEILHGGDIPAPTDRYLTAESLDLVLDEAINALRLAVRDRKTPKPAVATAIAAMVESKLKIRTLAWVAGAQRRLNPVREPSA